jgi:small GTP-binding protein
MSSPRNKGSFLTGSYRSQSVSQPLEPTDVSNNEQEAKEDVTTSESGAKTKRSAIEMLEKNESYKICVIGPQVGKTSLINRFLLGSYADNPAPTTAVQESKVELNFNNKDYIIEILDTSGDVNILTDIMINPEKQSKLFEAADGYMCVYSITSQASCDSIDAFIQMIRAVKRQDRVPLLLVGTLADESEKREVSIAAGKEKAELFDCPILEVSAKSGQNVDLSFVELLKILEKERTHAAELERKIQERLKARGNRKSIRAAPIKPEDVLAQQMQDANIAPTTRHTVATPSTSNVAHSGNQNTANPTPSSAKSAWTRVTKPGGTNTPPSLSPRQNIASVPAPLQPLNMSGDSSATTTPATAKVPPPPPPRNKDGRSGLSVSYDASVHSRFTETDAESYDYNGNYEGEEYYGDWDGEEWGEEGAYYEDADEIEDEQGYEATSPPQSPPPTFKPASLTGSHNSNNVVAGSTRGTSMTAPSTTVNSGAAKPTPSPTVVNNTGGAAKQPTATNTPAATPKGAQGGNVKQPGKGKKAANAAKDSSVVLAQLNLTNPNKCGWLNKVGAVRKSVKRRWFVLKDFTVAYFTSREQTRLLGAFSIQGGLVKVTDSASFTFTVTTPGRVWILTAETKQEMQSWMQELYKCIFRNKNFGLPLEFIASRAAEKGAPTAVPIIITKSIDFLRKKEATKLEGIFRISGDSRGINMLKDKFDTTDDATYVIPDDTDPHAVSGLLKLYFRELPAPLLTYSLYPHWIQSQTKDDPESRLSELSRLITQLPDHNRNSLKVLAKYLREVHDDSSVNKMHASNLSVVFGPTLIRERESNPAALLKDMKFQYGVIKDFIDHFERLFP